jgi:ribosome-binding protein aMBF1 (putative translation factor)
MQDEDGNCAVCGAVLDGATVVQLTLASQLVCVPCATGETKRPAATVERDNDGR